MLLRIDDEAEKPATAAAADDGGVGRGIDDDVGDFELVLLEDVWLSRDEMSGEKKKDREKMSEV